MVSTLGYPRIPPVVGVYHRFEHTAPGRAEILTPGASLTARDKTERKLNESLLTLSLLFPAKAGRREPLPSVLTPALAVRVFELRASPVSCPITARGPDTVSVSCRQLASAST